jgi:hypothetical protein
MLDTLVTATRNAPPGLLIGTAVVFLVVVGWLLWRKWKNSQLPEQKSPTGEPFRQVYDPKKYEDEDGG